MIDAILSLHILAGLVALATAGLALATAKGGAWHRRVGLTYAAAMLTVSVTALALLTVRPGVFLFGIVVFSFYLVFTGWRAAGLRDGRPRAADHAAGAAMALTGVAMLSLGAAGLVAPILNAAPPLGLGGVQPPVLLVFGAIGLTLALADLRAGRAAEPVTGPERISRHLTRMLAGTIATITGAATVNLAFLPELVAWLGPTVLLTPLVVWWNARVLRPTPAR